MPFFLLRCRSTGDRKDSKADHSELERARQERKARLERVKKMNTDDEVIDFRSIAVSRIGLMRSLVRRSAAPPWHQRERGERAAL
jgi:hypothetical protein